MLLIEKLEPFSADPLPWSTIADQALATELSNSSKSEGIIEDNL
jgi:hypothetical protein